MKRRKFRKRRVPKYLYIASISMFLSLGVGYSTLNSSFGMEGALTTTASTWNVHFDNIEYGQNNVIANPVSIVDNTLSVAVTLTNPGDKYEFSFDIENEGSLDALIRTLEMTDLSDLQKKYVTYSLTYVNGDKIQEGDLLKGGETKKAYVLVEYKKLRYEDEYPENDINLNLTMSINYYYPQQENYNVVLNYGGNQTNYQVLNTEQQLEISDLEISNNYKVIACNNGATANLNGNGKLVINNVKADTVCRLETSLKNAITNIGEGKSNITILRDDTTSDKASINSNQDITLDLNGKTYIIDGDYDSSYCITVYGKLTINDSVGTGILKTYDQYLLYVNSNNSVLNVNSGTYIRENANTTGAVVYSYRFSTGVQVNLKNSTFISDYAPTFDYNAAGNINIDNCNIENATTYDFATTSNLTNAFISVNNSTFKTPGNAITFSQGKNYMYLCHSTIEDASLDINLVPYNRTKIFYSNDTVFTSGTNVPAVNDGYSVFAINSSIACGE